MNEIDKLLNSISNYHPEHSDEIESLVDEHLAKKITTVNLKLRADRRISVLAPKVADELLKKTSEYIRLMGASFIAQDEDIRFDDFVDDSIEITFRKRKDMILNIYSNNDIEETYLSYSMGNDDMLVYNSLPAMVSFIKELLEHEN